MQRLQKILYLLLPLLLGASADGQSKMTRAGPDPRYGIAFASFAPLNTDMYRVHPDGSGLAQLTDSPAFDDQGALSPDGRSLAFVSSRGGQADIWVVELATGALCNMDGDSSIVRRATTAMDCESSTSRRAR